MGFFKTVKKAKKVVDLKINQYIDSLIDIQDKFTLTKQNMQEKLKFVVSSIEKAKVSRDTMERAMEKVTDEKMKANMETKLKLIDKNIDKAKKKCCDMKKEIDEIDLKQTEYCSQINALKATKEAMSAMTDFDSNFEDTLGVDSIIEEGEKEISRLNAEIESIDMLNF